MTEKTKNATTRRDFIKNTSRIATASALAGVAIPRVHAAEDNTIRLALIGCGGRGSGAVANAMAAGGLVMDNRFRDPDEENAPSSGPVKLFAMADLLQSRLDQSHKTLSKLLGDRIDAPQERRFLGFDAYRNA
ncbi:MAG: twin-arginine translocation signal domain-containing protein, partial [Planctomycetes bacterium]|nr:twin-arginine translocation signal domain-containing protein [Planctomycetota bacterium]